MPGPTFRSTHRRRTPALLARLTALLPTGLLLAMLLLAVTSLAPPAVLAAPGRAGPSAGPWQWPLPLSGSTGSSGPAGSVPAGAGPEVTRGFDPPDGPYGPGHRGVDLAAAPGTPVLAAGAGVVGYAGPLAGRGVVTVRHADGLRTTYEPVRALVRTGQHVAAGTVLGTLEPGHPGCPRPACLHWGLRRAATYLDPLSLLRHGPVRLLPLAGAAPGDVTPGPVRPAGIGTGPRPEADQTRLGPTDPPWSSLDTVAALGLAVVGALALSRRRPP